jgi:hypothetical protein
MNYKLLIDGDLPLLEPFAQFWKWQPYVGMIGQIRLHSIIYILLEIGGIDTDCNVDKEYADGSTHDTQG